VRAGENGKLAFPIRNIDRLFASSVTIQCALKGRCIPCSYKVCCFDVALDSEFCKLVPNERPESCPRAKPTAPEFDATAGETLGYTPNNHQLGLRFLTVGDGDFSFSLAVARLLSQNGDMRKTMLIATSYESKETLNKVYPNFDKTVSELECLGVTLCFRVDATRLAETLPSSIAKAMQFHRIVWNFPCTAISKGQDGQNDAMEHNKQLVRKFVENARRMIADSGGELQICHKTKPPFNQWKIEEVALELCAKDNPRVSYEGRIVLDRSLLRPYQPRKALHAKSFPCHDACFYVFRVAGSKKTTAEAQVATLFPTEMIEYNVTEERSRAGLYPVTPNIIKSIRDNLLAYAASKRSKDTAVSRRKKHKKR